MAAEDVSGPAYDLAELHKKPKVVAPEGFEEAVEKIVDDAINKALEKYEFAALEEILTQFKAALNDLNERVSDLETKRKWDDALSRADAPEEPKFPTPED